MPFLETPDPLIRLTEANYGDDVGSFADGPDAMAISRLLFDQDEDLPNDEGLSDLFAIWGQFLDHDLSLSPESHEDTFDVDGLPLPIGRSEFVLDDDGTRVPVNAISWQIDGSNVYGSDQDRLDDLRAWEDGKLKMIDDLSSARCLLPKATLDAFMAGEITAQDAVFLAGDVRANENPNLLSIHTMFGREHNHWAERLAEEHPDWDDEQLFNGARQIVEFQLQKITYDEWLPHLIGDAVPDDWTHDPEVNGQISVEFSTAAFRFGHTMVNSDVRRIDEYGEVVGGEHMGLADAFFNHTEVENGGIDDLIRGMLTGTAQETDTQVVDDLNFLLGNPDGVSGFSLVALNILRGQDHGLQSYVDTRAALLGDIDPDTIDPLDFSIITADEEQQAKLAEVFDTVHDVPLWVGGLAEDDIDGTQLGPLFTHIIADQFIRTRAADETFGVLDDALGAAIIEEVMESDFSALIERTTDVDMVQACPFMAAQRDREEGDMPKGTDAMDVMMLEAEILDGDLKTGGGDDVVALSGGTTISGAIKTGTGDDTVLMTSGDVGGNIATGKGDDTVALSGTASVGGCPFTGAGADRVTMSDMAHVAGHIGTGSEDDLVELSGKARVDGAIKTGTGDDRIDILDEASVGGGIFAGSGDDEIRLDPDAEVGLVHGGAGYDTLSVGGRFRIEPGAGDGNGTIVHLDQAGQEIGRTEFKDVENVICFTPGTRILTGRGIRRIETLAVGDMVWTVDDGLAPVRWIGTTTVLAGADLAPVRIAKGALGNDRDIEVSPQHRMLLDDWRAEVLFGSDEVLAPARALINDRDVRPAAPGPVTYIHIAFDRHQIVMAEGIPTESFYPGAQALSTLDAATRAEVLALFPEWAGADRVPLARPCLTQTEARLLRSRLD